MTKNNKIVDPKLRITKRNLASKSPSKQEIPISFCSLESKIKGERKVNSHFQTTKTV